MLIILDSKEFFNTTKNFHLTNFQIKNVFKRTFTKTLIHKSHKTFQQQQYLRTIFVNFGIFFGHFFFPQKIFRNQFQLPPTMISNPRRIKKYSLQRKNRKKKKNPYRRLKLSTRASLVSAGNVERLHSVFIGIIRI